MVQFYIRRNPHHYYKVDVRDAAEAARYRSFILQSIAADNPFLKNSPAFKNARINTSFQPSRVAVIRQSPHQREAVPRPTRHPSALKHYGSLALEGGKRGIVDAITFVPEAARVISGQDGADRIMGALDPQEQALYRAAYPTASDYIRRFAERIGFTNPAIEAKGFWDHLALDGTRFVSGSAIPGGGLAGSGVRALRSVPTILLGAATSVAGGEIAARNGYRRENGQLIGGIVGLGIPAVVPRALQSSREALGAFGPEFTPRAPYFPPTEAPHYKGRAQLVDGIPGQSVLKPNPPQQRTAKGNVDILHPMPARTGRRIVRNSNAKLDSIWQLDARRAVGMLRRLQGTSMYEGLNRFMMADLTPAVMWDRILEGGHFLDARKVVQNERAALAHRPEARTYLAALDHLDKTLESLMRRQNPGIGTALRASQGLPIRRSAPRRSYPQNKSPAQVHFEQTGEYPANTFTHETGPNYPSQYSPSPPQPMHVTQGSIYAGSKRKKKKANTEVRDIWGMKWLPEEIHEIQSVKLGGDPVDPVNKVILPYDVHRKQMNPYWRPYERIPRR